MEKELEFLKDLDENIVNADIAFIVNSKGEEEPGILFVIGAYNENPHEIEIAFTKSELEQMLSVLDEYDI